MYPPLGSHLLTRFDRANLSSDYFTNRQDRYICFQNSSPLANYFHALMSSFRPLSFVAKGGSSSAGSSALDVLWKDDRIPRPDVHSRSYTDAAREVLHDFMASHAQLDDQEVSTSRSDDSLDTLLQPFLQMGTFGIKQETEMVVPSVVDAVRSNHSARIDWTSGYFSLRQSDREALLSSACDVSIVCAAPEANGFFRSPGFSYYIPPAYTYLERKFHDAIVARGRQHGVELREWKRDGWTYHAKGVWLSNGAGQDPHLTLLGSSNYGNRSAVRDIEVNLAVQTSSEQLRRALGAEVSNIKQHASDKVDAELFKRKDRHVGWLNRLAAR